MDPVERKVEFIVVCLRLVVNVKRRSRVFDSEGKAS